MSFTAEDVIASFQDILNDEEFQLYYADTLFTPALIIQPINVIDISSYESDSECDSEWINL